MRPEINDSGQVMIDGDNEVKIYRSSRFNRLLAFAFVLIFAGVVGFGIFSSFWKDPSFPSEAKALQLKVFWIAVFGFMLCLSIFETWRAYVSYLIITPNELRLRRFWRIRRIGWTEIKRVEWKHVRHPKAARVRIVGPVPLKIEPNYFDAVSRKQILATIFERVPIHLQHDWENYTKPRMILSIKTQEKYGMIGLAVGNAFAWCLLIPRGNLDFVMFSGMYGIFTAPTSLWACFRMSTWKSTWIMTMIALFGWIPIILFGLRIWRKFH
jgi:hypothetical protein